MNNIDRRKIKNLDFKRLLSTRNPKNFRSNLGLNKNYFRETKNNNNEKSKNFLEEEKSNINQFNKTFNNQHMFRQIMPKETFYKLNNNNYNKNKIQKSKTIEGIISGKKLPKNLSSITISKDSTLYKTKNNFLNSLRFENFKDKNKSVINPKKSSFYPQNRRSFSASVINFKPNNEQKKNSLINNAGNGGFITALSPEVAKGDNSHDKNNRSYFMRKIASEKKFLSYFDIQRIYLLDKKVYKPNINFERKVYELKSNNTDEFIMNFNFEEYRVKVLRLFQRHVSMPNYQILKKNFELIKKGWTYKDSARCHRKKIRKIPESETERELEYNRIKLEREQRIKEKYMNKNNKK